MHYKTFDVIAPFATGKSYSEAEALGAAVWLWMQSEAHRQLPLFALGTVLLPCIKRGQFALASQNGQHAFFISFAALSEEAERRYLTQPLACMPECDWKSGDRLWIIDWVAPQGDTRVMASLSREKLFPSQVARTLYHRGDERGMRVLELRGKAVLAEEARHWYATHPLSVPLGDLPLRQTSPLKGARQ